MMWSLLATHVVAVVASLAVGSRPERGNRLLFPIAALPALAGAAIAIGQLTQGAHATSTSVTWVDELDIVLALRLDDLSALFLLIVAGIGALIFVYANGYFDANAAGVARFAATLSAFSGSMIGLVLADSI